MVSPFLLFVTFHNFLPFILPYVYIPRILIREALVSRDGKFVQNMHKIECCLVPRNLLDEASAICFPQLTKLIIVIKPSNPSNYTLILSYSNRGPSIFQAALCTKKYQYRFDVFLSLL